MFFRFFMNMWFTCGLFVGVVAGWHSFGGKFGLITNLLITIAPSTLLFSVLGISIGARYSLALSISFIAVSLITSGAGIIKCLLVGTAVGICAFTLIVAIELIEGAIDMLKEIAESIKNSAKIAFSELKIAITNRKNRVLQKIYQ